MDYDLYPFPSKREIVVDAGYLGTGRRITYALVELDVTRARESCGPPPRHRASTLSFTALHRRQPWQGD